MQLWNAAYFIVTLSGILGIKGTACTTSQNLHNLLRHPHYADKYHQHSTHFQASHSSMSRPFEGRSSRLQSTPSGTHQEVGVRWQRAAPKEYYKMNGYAVKSTSATKGTHLDPSEIPQEWLEVREANEHFVRMRSRARCQFPRPQVLCVRDVYPEKEFLPRCTLLHRCSETSGCCDEESTCGPRSVQEVALHFYVLGGDHKSSNVEKLLFVNHTECECRPRLTPVNASSAVDVRSRVLIDHYPQGDQNRKCRSCPSPFCVREMEDGRCVCDCFDRHRPCIRIKRGREALADAERRCVLAGHCSVPDCDHGMFDPDKGRCPKRPDHEIYKEMDNGRRPHPSSRNPNHRWNYFERD